MEVFENGGVCKHCENSCVLTQTHMTDVPHDTQLRHARRRAEMQTLTPITKVAQKWQ